MDYHFVLRRWPLQSNALVVDNGMFCLFEQQRLTANTIDNSRFRRFWRDPKASVLATLETARGGIHKNS